MLGIDTNLDTDKMAIKLADLLFEQLHKDYDRPNLMVEVFAPRREKMYGEAWTYILQESYMKYRTV